MATDIEICNLALSMVGQKPITNLLNPQSYNEQVCQQWYPVARDSVTESNDWTWAMGRCVLTLSDPASPCFGFDNAFLLPTDCLRVVWAGIQPDEKQYAEFDWRVEERKLLVSSDLVYIRYIKRVTTTSIFPPLVVDAIAARLGMELAIPIAESIALKKELRQLYSAKWDQAIANNALQGRSERIRSKKLLLAR